MHVLALVRSRLEGAFGERRDARLDDWENE
jgi:hypothetical protein